MLVLSRWPGQRIYIDLRGASVVLEVLGSDRGEVRLGFIAPPSVRIDREEVHERRAATADRPPATLGGTP